MASFCFPLTLYIIHNFTQKSRGNTQFYTK
nr:MAG TPA: hypothetical protein [Caudoviricetes sp.]